MNGLYGTEGVGTIIGVESKIRSARKLDSPTQKSRGFKLGLLLKLLQKDFSCVKIGVLV